MQADSLTLAPGGDGTAFRVMRAQARPLAKSIRIEPAFDDRRFVRVLFNRHVRYRAVAASLPDGSDDTAGPRWVQELGFLETAAEASPLERDAYPAQMTSIDFDGKASLLAAPRTFGNLTPPIVSRLSPYGADAPGWSASALWATF